MSEPFADQVAIVTGGGQGLGKAIAIMLSANGAAAVAIFDINEDKGWAVVKMLHNGLFCWVDVSDEDSVKVGFQRVRDKYGRLDIMVNCAGIAGPNYGLYTEYLEATEFDMVYAVNVRGSFLMTKYSLLEMKKRNYGRILLIASYAGKEGSAETCAYSTSKAAVIGLVKSTGKEYAETGITVNALAPTLINTALLTAQDPQLTKRMFDKIPMKRYGTFEEVASITKFIVSKEASFNTAFCFDLTGGRDTY